MSDDMKEKYEFVKDKFLQSKFYDKYNENNKYYVESVLKHIFKEDIGHSNVTDCKIEGSSTCGSATYSQVVEQNCKVIGDFIELFVKPFCEDNDYDEYENIITEMIRGRYSIKSKKREGGIYLDPDERFDNDKINKKEFGNIEFSYDGLISINSILLFYKLLFNKRILLDKEEFIKEYKDCREIPIFFFPSIRQKNRIQTINTGRYSSFKDRIDYLLFDMKNYLEGKDCKMSNIYNQGDTNKWLIKVKERGGFEYLVKLYDIDDIFVKKEGDDYKIIDIENNDGKTFINKYLDNKNDYEWKEKYYNNLKSMIIDFKNKLNNSDK